MKCDGITEQMSEALDGPLDAKQQAAFDAHLAGCPGCREGFDALGETVAQLHELPAVTPPADLIVGINATIDRPHGLHLSWNLFNTPPMRVALAASLVLVVGLLGIQYLDPAPRDTAIKAVPPAPPVDNPAEAVAMLEEAALGEDDRMAKADAEAMVDQEVGGKRAESSRRIVAAPQKTASAPVVAPARVDRDEAVWADPAPAGLKGGLHVGNEMLANRGTGGRQETRARKAPMMKRRVEAESAVATTRLAKSGAVVRVVQISVKGLSREAVLQAVE